MTSYPNPYYGNLADDRYLYSNYDVKAAYAIVMELYTLAKKDGLTEEQRSFFFDMIKKHNQGTHRMLYSISAEHSASKSEEKVYFDESELGSYAGYYSLGSDNSDESSENNNFYRYSKCLFSIKGEHLIEDKTNRVTLEETRIKWNRVLPVIKQYQKYASDDLIKPVIYDSSEDLPF